MRNYFTLAGRDSRDFGVYISGDGTFNSPEKAYDFFEIPGRNGDLIGSNQRLMNVELTYRAFISNNFKKNMANFRSFLLSLNGYQRLTDSYHPDEFRLVCYTGAMEVEPTQMLDAGQFEITFICKPQRYLLTGETTYLFNSTAQQLSGQSVRVFVPWLDRSVFKWEESANVGRPQSSPENVQEIYSLSKANVYVDGVRTYSFELYGDLTVASIDLVYMDGTRVAKVMSAPTTGWTLHDTNIFKVALANAGQAQWCTHYPAMSLADLSTAPYGVAIDNEVLYIKDSRYTTASDFMNGVPLNAVKIDAVLFLPEFFMLLTPYFPSSTGIAVISTDPGATLTVKESDAPLGRLSNPEPFQSQPLIRIYGTGQLEINGITITVSSVGTSYTDIDCEIMDCYEGSSNRNAYVSFSTYDFPVIVPGVTNVNILDNTITQVEITPRWWRV